MTKFTNYSSFTGYWEFQKAVTGTKTSAKTPPITQRNSTTCPTLVTHHPRGCVSFTSGTSQPSGRKYNLFQITFALTWPRRADAAFTLDSTAHSLLCSCQTLHHWAERHRTPLGTSQLPSFHSAWTPTLGRGKNDLTGRTQGKNLRPTGREFHMESRL